MNSKAIRKQLLAAVAMVLVAAVALGSSTYAWFVASGTVTATGMKVHVQSEGGLVISYDGEAWGTSASANMTDTELLPTSTSDLTEWVHASADDPSEFTAADGSYTNISKKILDATKTGLDAQYIKNNGYVILQKFLVRSADGVNKSKGLFVKDINVTLANDADPVKTLSTALRVAVKCGDNDYIFGPVSVVNGSVTTTATQSYTVYSVDETTNEATAQTPKFTLDQTGQSAVLVGNTTEITDNEAGVPVYIYIWFEGEDAHLFSDNYNVENLNISVDFQSFSSLTA